MMNVMEEERKMCSRRGGVRGPMKTPHGLVEYAAPSYPTARFL